MAFTPKNFEEGRQVILKFSTGETVVKYGAVIADTDGYYIMAGSSTAEDIRYVALQTVTTTADGQEVLCYETTGARFIADTDANPARTDVGTYADLASVTTVNPDASSNDLFYIEDIVGAVADKKVVGFFTRGVPNS